MTLSLRTVYPLLPNWFVGCCCLLLSLQTIATEVYVTRDASGNFVFSDQVSPAAEKHVVRPLPTMPAIQIPVPSRVKQNEGGSINAKQSQPVPYQLSILYPRDRDNLPPGEVSTLELIAGLQPVLSEQDTLILQDNGRTYDEGRELRIPISRLTPGEHTLQLLIKNQHNDVIKQSNPITIYIQRHSVLRKPAK